MKPGNPLTPSEAWSATLGELQLQMPRPTFETWLKPTYVLAHEDGTFVIATHNPYARDWLENRLMGVIKATLTKIVGQTVEVRFTVRPQAWDRQQDAAASQALVTPESQPAQTASVALPQTSPAAEPHEVHHLWQPVASAEALAVRPGATDCRSNLDPRYTFETFIVGKGNQLAHAAALAVTEHPAERYNPLFLYGGVGLGKTHLLHAIGHRLARRSLKVMYVSTEQFTNEMVNAIRRQKTDEFRARYRVVDVLLVDDIQFIAGKESTQEEFFHTFNTLHASNGQIVISSDRPPKAFTTLEQRLRSRFEWGLIADIQPPDLETRIAILRDKAERQHAQVPMTVLEYIAHQVQTNIRELEGALTQVLAYSELMHRPLTPETAENALRSLVAQRPRPSCEEVLEAVADFFHVDLSVLTGPQRNRQVVIPRQVAMYLMRTEAEASLPQIGQALGGRDHSTVLHGCEKIASALEEDQGLRRDVLALRERLQNHRNAR